MAQLRKQICNNMYTTLQTKIKTNFVDIFQETVKISSVYSGAGKSRKETATKLCSETKHRHAHSTHKLNRLE